MKKFAVYRAYDVKNVLLYAGRSLNVFSRLIVHGSRSEWFQYVSRIEVTWFGNKSDATAAEIEAIKTEHPDFNWMHRKWTYRLISDGDGTVSFESTTGSVNGKRK